jgi:hypothetical protein
MVGGGVIFSFKCPQGHLTDRRFPPGTPYAENDEITCLECLKADVANQAYLIFAFPEQMGKKDGNGRNS